MLASSGVQVCVRATASLTGEPMHHWAFRNGLRIYLETVESIPGLYGGSSGHGIFLQKSLKIPQEDTVSLCQTHEEVRRDPTLAS